LLLVPAGERFASNPGLIMFDITTFGWRVCSWHEGGFPRCPLLRRSRGWGGHSTRLLPHRDSWVQGPVLRLGSSWYMAAAPTRASEATGHEQASMVLVPPFDLKFLHELAAGTAGTSNRRHWSVFQLAGRSQIRHCRAPDQVRGRLWPGSYFSRLYASDGCAGQARAWRLGSRL